MCVCVCVLNILHIHILHIHIHTLSVGIVPDNRATVGLRWKADAPNGAGHDYSGCARRGGRAAPGFRASCVRVHVHVCVCVCLRVLNILYTHIFHTTHNRLKREMGAISGIANDGVGLTNLRDTKCPEKHLVQGFLGLPLKLSLF